MLLINFKNDYTFFSSTHIDQNAGYIASKHLNVGPVFHPYADNDRLTFNVFASYMILTTVSIMQLIPIIDIDIFGGVLVYVVCVFCFLYFVFSFSSMNGSITKEHGQSLKKFLLEMSKFTSFVNFKTLP